MSLSRLIHNMDRGRLMIVPIFMLLLVLNGFAILNEFMAIGHFSILKAAMLMHRVLIVCFYGLWILLYIGRSSARATTDSFIAKAIAVAASFMPFAIPFLSRPVENSGMMLLADIVTIAGMTITLFALNALGRSISIIPQARSFVQTGPYRIVRHPLYLGELIAVLGLVLARSSVSAAGLFIVITALQVYRACQEEKLLAATFPEYGPYSMDKARFIPGIF